MRRLVRHGALGWVVAAALLVAPTAVAAAAGEVEQWRLVNPEGVIIVQPIKMNTHPSSLEGKTIALFWNGKHNGDLFLTRVGELLEQQVKDVKIVKIWEKHPNTPNISGSVEKSKAKAQIVASYKPDLVISSQCD